MNPEKNLSGLPSENSKEENKGEGKGSGRERRGRAPKWGESSRLELFLL